MATQTTVPACSYYLITDVHGPISLRIACLGDADEALRSVTAADLQDAKDEALTHAEDDWGFAEEETTELGAALESIGYTHVCEHGGWNLYRGF